MALVSIEMDTAQFFERTLSRSSKLSVQKVLLGPFYCTPRPSGISLESSELEYILLVPANRAKDAQNPDARKAVSATVSVLK